MIAVSVIIPTHNRAALLPLTLESLARQDLSAGDYEVIVVADGCTDGTMHLLQSWKAPFALVVLEQTPGRGAAAARNVGAERAAADLLLFLDDDMDASPQLLSEHLRSHRQRGGCVVLGYFPMQPPAADEDIFTKAARIWWADRFANRSHRGYRYTFNDLCTGNVSLSRVLFLQLGKFDEQVGRGAGEDYELGYRLLQEGVRFRYVPRAASIHRTHQPLEVSLRRAQQDGYGQALIVRRHPELFWSFNISIFNLLAESIFLRPLWRAIWRWPALLILPGGLLLGGVRLLASIGLHSIMWRPYKALRGYHYWRGVRAALGTLAAWERLAQDAPLEPPSAREVDFDILRDLPRIDELIGSVASTRSGFGTMENPWDGYHHLAGAEPLTGEHVRNLLVQRFKGVLLSAVTRQRGITASYGERLPARHWTSSRNRRSGHDE